MNALFECVNAFGDSRLSYSAATAMRKDAELPLPDDGQARFVAWLVPDEDLDNWQAADARRDRAADCTATAIVQLLDQAAGTPVQPVNPAHVAVLTRTNQEAEQVATALQLRGVPAVVRSDKDVMQSDMA